MNPSAPSLQDLQTDHYTWLAQSHHLNPNLIQDFRNLMSETDVTILCDDSASMATPLTGTTAWLESKNLVASLIQILPQPIDLYSFGCSPLRQINNLPILDSFFNRVPHSAKNLEGQLYQIYNDKISLSPNKKLLIIVLTNSYPIFETALYNAFLYVTQQHQIYISYVHCVPCPWTPPPASSWSNYLHHFGYIGHYNDELLCLHRANGVTYQYVDYVLQVIMTPFIPFYFNYYPKVMLQTQYSQSCHHERETTCCSLF